MIQLMICVCRNESVSPEEFRKHWKETQGPTVRGLMELMGAQRATQALTLEVERNRLIRERYRTAAPFDGIITLHFEHPDLLQKNVGSPDIMNRIIRIYQDQIPYVDLPRCSAFYTETPIDLTAFNPNRREEDFGSYEVEEHDLDDGG